MRRGSARFKRGKYREVGGWVGGWSGGRAGMVSDMFAAVVMASHGITIGGLFLSNLPNLLSAACCLALQPNRTKQSAEDFYAVLKRDPTNSEVEKMLANARCSLKYCWNFSHYNSFAGI